MSKKPKLTPWFPGTVKPTRPGIYIATVSNNKFFRYWNGEWWSNGCHYLGDLQDAPRKRAARWVGPAVKRWRGLAEKP